MDLLAFLAFSNSITRGLINFRQVGLLSIFTILVPMDQNVYVLYAGRPNFSYFTTVIVINFEADYLLNRWTYRNTGVTLILNF
jgi:hypothetical protein